MRLEFGMRRLLPAVREAEHSTLIVADGFSCREQIAQQPPYRRRASLPPGERTYTTSYHHIGTRSGMHPEDQPYMSATRSRYTAPTTHISVEEGREGYTRQPAPTSARRYDLAPYAGRGEQRTEELARQ